MTPSTASHNRLGDISLLFAWTLLRSAAAEGACSRALAQQFDLPPEGAASADARISIPRYMRLGKAAIDQTGNPNLGLRVGAQTRACDLGMAGLAAQTATSVRQALETLVRYSALTSQNSRGAPVCQSGCATVRFYSIRPYNGYNRFVVDSVLASWTQLARALSCQSNVLEKVSIEYSSQGHDALFEQWFRCPVHFGANENSVRFRQDVWRCTPVTAQAAMHAKLVRVCEQEYQQLRRGWRLSDRVRETVTPLLGGTPPTLAELAKRLGMTPWTLQRKLANEGTSYRQTLDAIRRELAQAYLQETDNSISEIAWLLGFANPPAFHKAYKRWFGTTPGTQKIRHHHG